jgi:hypothetical protein
VKVRGVASWGGELEGVGEWVGGVVSWWVVELVGGWVGGWVGG